MKKFPWLQALLVTLPLVGMGLLAFTELKSDVRILESAWAAGEKNYKSLDTTVKSIQRDVRSQGTSQAVTAQKIRDIQDQIKGLEKSSSENNRLQADLLRKILRSVER